MTTFGVAQAGARLGELLELAAESHEPIQITGTEASGVLLSENDWRGIQETLYLLSVPGLRDSIREGMAEPLDEAQNTPGW